SRRRHTRWPRDWSSDVCSSDLAPDAILAQRIIVQINTGFSFYPLADPHLLADITLNSQLQSNDVSNIQRAIVQIAVANIPALPRSEERRVGKERSGGWWRWEHK